MLMKRFFRRIADDFRQKELFPLKIIFFVKASTLFVLYPYLTIYMRELGISIEETAIAAAITPAVSIIMPPVAGVLADRIGNFKILLAVMSSLGGVAALLMLLVPVGRYTLVYPQEALLSMGCSKGGNGFDLQWAHRLPCSPTSETSFDAPLTVHGCGVVCSDGDAVLESAAYTVGLPPANSFTFARPALGELPVATKTLPGRHVLLLEEDLSTNVRKLAGGKAFLPLPGLFEVGCVQDIARNDSIACYIGRSPNENPASLGLPPQERHFRAKISTTVNIEPGIEDPRHYSVVEVSAPGNITDPDSHRPLVFSSTPQSASCAAGPPAEMTVSAGPAPLGACEHRCLVSAPRKLFCTDEERLVEINPQLTFWLYLAVRVFVGIIGSTAFAMFEGAVIAILREHKADYGLQRIYASIGSMISSPLSGLMIDYASAGKGYTDFRPAFYLYAALKVLGGLLMLTINLEFKAPSHNVVSDVMSAMRNVEMVALFIACFILGTAWGYIESFLFWLLQDLGASRSLMGITITVGGIAGIPLLALSGPIIKKLGHANVLFVGFIFYAIRLLGYSLIYNPWLCLIFEAMESFTSSLATTASVTYAAALSTSSTDTSIQGLIGGIYHGVGRGSGSLIGGYLMKAFGTRVTFRIFAAGTLITGVIYFLFNHFYFTRRRQQAAKKSEDGRTAGEVVSYPDDKEAGLNMKEKEKEKDLEASQQVTCLPNQQS